VQKGDSEKVDEPVPRGIHVVKKAKKKTEPPRSENENFRGEIAGSCVGGKKEKRSTRGEERAKGIKNDAQGEIGAKTIYGTRIEKTNPKGLY